MTIRSAALARGKPTLPAKWNEKAVFDVPEVAELLEIPVWSIYELIKNGGMRAVRIGRRLRVPRHVIEEILEA
jgi:excisionase family DNA binding protein